MGSIGRSTGITAAAAVIAGLGLASDGVGGPAAMPAAGSVADSGSLPGRDPTRLPATRPPVPSAPLPLSWEVNRGQSHRDVRYLARARGYAAFVTDRDLTFAFGFPGSAPDTVAVVPVRMRLAGSDGPGALRADDPLPGVTNYLRGPEATWVTNVPSWRSVRREGAYPGIDMVVGGRGDSVEYSFELAPGADPARIALAFEGVARTSLSAGDLVLSTGSGDVIHRAPEAFQETASGRRAVAARFYLRSDGSVGFDLGPYDRSRALVIDPVVSPTTYHGSPTQIDEMHTGGYGNAGDIYMAGFSDGFDYPVTGSAFQTSQPGLRDGVITRLNATATARVYSTYLGGASQDQVEDLHIDRATGAAYLTGTTFSTDFPGTGTGFATAKPSGSTADSDAFLTVLNAAGSAVLYGTYIGGNLAEQGNGVYANSLGIAVVGGSRGPAGTNVPAFPFTASPFGTEDTTSADGFVITIDTNVSGGSSQLDAAPVRDAGNGDQSVRAVHIDELNVVTVCGSTTAAMTGVNNVNAYVASFDGIVVRFSDETLATVTFSDHVGGNAIDECVDLVVAGTLVYVSGTSTSSASFPFANALYTYRGGTDAFVTVLDPVTPAMPFSTMWGGSGNEGGIAIAVDIDGTIHVGGSTDTDNAAGPFNLLPLSGNAIDTTYAGGLDAYFLSIGTPLGTPTLQYASYFGGSAVDSTFDIATDDSGSTLIVGWTSSADFPTTGGVITPSLGGTRDGFAAVLVTQTMTLRPDFAHLTDAIDVLYPKGDKFKIDGNFTFTANATNTSFNPTTDALTATVIHNGETHQLAVPANDPKWKNKGGGLYKITRNEGGALTPKWTICFNAIAKTFTVTKTRFDFADIPDPLQPVVLKIDISSGGGNNDGTATRIFSEGGFNGAKNETVLRYNE